MSNHTPIPYYVQTTRQAPVNGQHIIASVPLDEDNFIAYVEGRTPEEARANAEFIVRACNNHGRLVAALRTIVSLDSDAHPGLLTWQDARKQAHDEAFAAITEAIKETP